MSSSTDSVLTDLNLLLPPDLDDIDAAITDDSTFDALAPFTDTLFYDWDLGRFLDVERCNIETYPEQHRPLESSNDSTVEGLGIDGGDGAGFYAGATATTTTTTTISSSLLTQSLSALGYDFLNFKFPDDQQQGAAGGGIQHSQSARPLLQAAAIGATSAAAAVQPSIDATISPQSTSMMQSPTSSTYATSSSSQSPPATILSTSDAHILSIQEAARCAAEEDKRRRNTAASARFRIKKKQRDMAIEKAAKEMENKVSDLEKKISSLELENRWLRNLLVEKNSAVAEAGIRRGV